MAPVPQKQHEQTKMVVATQCNWTCLRWDGDLVQIHRSNLPTAAIQIRTISAGSFVDITTKKVQGQYLPPAEVAELWAKDVVPSMLITHPTSVYTAPASTYETTQIVGEGTPRGAMLQWREQSWPHVFATRHFPSPTKVPNKFVLPFWLCRYFRYTRMSHNELSIVLGLPVFFSVHRMLGEVYIYIY